ncbi:hypothetical protein A0256_22135 [Mucilaginibacter sp. PAMC 26640]|nr:hypothetical protein A0256_22135 [Mucilaginibacter sp. PAMC 26640]
MAGLIHKRFETIDLLRGIAAISVCFFHFGFFRYGCTGVDLFFIISGFVIFMSIKRATSVKEFWISRFIRLYPSYWLSIVIGIISVKLLSNISPSLNFRHILGNITMFQPIFRTEYISSVYWTLYVEMLFYIIITILWLLRWLPRIEMAVAISLVLVAIVNFSFLVDHNTHPLITRSFVLLRYLFPLVSHIQFFGAGIIFYLSVEKGYNLNRLLLLFLTIVITGLSHTNSVMMNSYLGIWEHVGIYTLLLFVFAGSIYEKIKLSKLSSLLIFGEISYALYLIHDTFGLDLRNFLLPALGSNSSAFIALLSTLIVSVFITYWFDIPLRQYLKRLTRS